MNRDGLFRLVQEANLAPSVHNTQPTRWRQISGDSALVLEDTSRTLPVGDPEGRDAAISHGAAIEGFSLAAAAKGLSVHFSVPDAAPLDGMRVVAQLSLAAGAAPEPLRHFAAERRTYRGVFRAAPPSAAEALLADDDVILVRTKDAIASLAAMNDEAGLRAFRNIAYRAELLSWMRLSRRDPRWGIDGLNADAMEMSRLEAAGAGLVLRPGIFEALDQLRLANLFVAEAAVVRSAHAIVLFHRPAHEAPLITGRRFYRLWLTVARAGLSAAPMAVLADDPSTRARIAQDYAIPSDRRLITAQRIGQAPPQIRAPKPRLPVASLMV